MAIITAFFGIAFARIDLGPFSITPFRGALLLACLLLLAGILMRDGKLYSGHIRVKYYLLFLALWLAYALFSMAWAIDKESALKDIFFLVMGVLIIFLMVYYFSNLRDLQRLYDIWLFMLVVLISLGLWENITGNHLSVSISLLPPGVPDYIPTGFYHNQNNYAFILALSIPFAIIYIRYSSSLLKRLCGAAIVIITLYLLFIIESRASWLAIVLGIAFWFIFLIKASGKLKIMALIGVSAVIFILVLPEIAEKTHLGIIEQMRTLSGVIGLAPSGEPARLNLIKNSLVFTVNSFGVGVGPGNLHYYMEHYSVYPVGPFREAINWWAHLLAEYGVLVFAGFVAFYLSLIFRLFQAHSKLAASSEKMVCEALLIGLISFFFASMGPSNTFTVETWWILFGFALAFLNYYRNKKAES